MLFRGQLCGVWCLGSGGGWRVEIGPVTNNPQGNNQASSESFATPDWKPRLDVNVRKRYLLYSYSLKFQISGHTTLAMKAVHAHTL